MANSLLLNANALNIPLADKSVQVCVTSPPYICSDVGWRPWVQSLEAPRFSGESSHGHKLERGEHTVLCGDWSAFYCTCHLHVF